jgi:hypothetical protein
MSTSQLFNDKELIVSKNSDGEFLSSGFTVNSLLWKNALSPISSVGGGVSSGGKVSSLFDNLAVPAGLMYQKAGSQGRNKSWMDEINLALDENFSPGEQILIDDLHADLTSKALYKGRDPNKKHTHNTMKRHGGNKNKISRKRNKNKSK